MNTKQTKRLTAAAVVLAVSVLLPMPVIFAQTRPVETGIVKLADSNIQYFSRGQGETIVLLPGGTLTVGYLDGLAEALAKAGYRVVGINFRGSGKSTGSSRALRSRLTRMTWQGHSGLKLGPVHVAGNDFGNRVARMWPRLTLS